MYKATFRAVYNLYKLYSRGYKWLCYAAFNAGICTLFMLRYHTCTNCILKANSCSKCRFCRAWLSAELLFQVLGTVSSSASVKCCPSHLGRYIVPISARKMFPVFVRLWAYATETFTRCVRKSRHLNREKSGVLSHIKELTATWNRGQNLFALTGWICLLNAKSSDIKC